MKFFIISLIVGVLAVADANTLGTRSRNPECPKVCSRIWRPVCSKLNGVPLSISNKCMLDDLMHCGSAADNKIWEFVHLGSCQNDEDAVKAESELPLIEEAGENYYEIQPEDGEVDEQVVWPDDYELSEK